MEGLSLLGESITTIDSMAFSLVWKRVGILFIYGDEDLELSNKLQAYLLLKLGFWTGITYICFNLRSLAKFYYAFWTLLDLISFPTTNLMPLI